MLDPTHTPPTSLLPFRRVDSAQRATLATFLIVWLSLFAWMPRVMDRLDPLTGDEPFYVMTSFSILDDLDLNEQNNYEQRDYDRFYPAFGPTRSGWSAYPDPLPPHATHTARTGIYSKHGLGMSLIVALPWHVGGRTLTLVVLAAIAALVASNTVLLALRFGAGPWLAIGLALLLAFTNPLLSHSLLIFPEVTAGLCIVYTVRRLFQPVSSSWHWLLTGCATALLPWLHYRLTAISVVLVAAALFRLWMARNRREFLMFLASPVISVLAMISWHRFLYGTIRPPASDHAGFSDLAGAINGFGGTLLDQQWGAIVHNPTIALAIIATFPFVRHHRRECRLLAAVVFPYIALVSTYRVWWGEWNPPARYLTDIVPLTAAPLGWWLSRLNGRISAAALAAAALPALAVSATFVHDPQLMYNQPDGTSRLLETWSEWIGQDLTGFIPSYVFYSESPRMDRIVFGCGIALILYVAAEAALRHQSRNT